MRDIKEIIDIRQRLHSHPDISGQEAYAHNLIVDFLSRLHPDAIHTEVGGYGVVAYWKSPIKDAKTIAFRADIDALPIGHRCGHDGHTTMLLRFAEMVSETSREVPQKSQSIVPNVLPYNIVLVFQPEEETGKGAKKIVDSGLLQKYGVAAIFGLHNLPGYPEGTVVLNRTTFAAASSGVVYRLVGRPTHASTPEKGLNPGRAAAAIIQRMDDLNRSANDINVFRQSTLICCRVGEEAFGTSAGSGEVMFTLRTFTSDAMLHLMNAADSIAAEEAERWHLELEKQLREPFRATENTPHLVDQLKVVLSPHLQVETITTPFRWSEDFAEYLHILPGAFFGLGSGERQPELHHPSYNFPDAIIETGAHCFELIMKNIKI